MYGRVAEQSCLSLLQICDSLFKLTQVQAQILKYGLRNNPLVLTRFASTASDLKAIQYACSFIFCPQSDPYCSYDTFLFNTVIKAYAETSNYESTAVSYYDKMLSLGIKPNNYTYPFLFKACAAIRDLSLGRILHGSVLKLGFYEDPHVINSMIKMYCSSSDSAIKLAEKVFDEAWRLSRLNEVSWATMMGGYMRWGMSNETIGLFRRMQQTASFKPNQVTLIAVLSAITDLGALDLGRWVDSYIKNENIQVGTELCNAMIDMFAKCGDVDKALNLFRNMHEIERTVVSWTSIIFGLALHGRGLEAVALFEEMRLSREIVPDDVLFIGLLSACSHSGLVREGRRYFDLMVNDYGIVPRIEHYGCMVDLLSRAGLVEETVAFVESMMPMAPNSVIKRTLVKACSAHGEALRFGERVAKDLIVNEPSEESNYVMLSSLYATMSEWRKKTMVRELMGKKGIMKSPGTAIQ